MREIAAWKRKFQVWQYSVSHSTLLLRSYHPQRYDTRVDVCFPAVSLMKLQPSYGSLVIHEVDDEEVVRFLPDQPLAEGAFYLLNDGAGYVRAAKCAWHEDEGDHRAPSQFGPLRGTA